MNKRYDGIYSLGNGAHISLPKEWIGKKVKTILLSSSLMVIRYDSNTKCAGYNVFEATRGQDTPLAKYCTANPLYNHLDSG